MQDAKFKPGDHVIVGGNITERVDRVIYCRNMIAPVYKIEWWHEGLPQAWEVEEEDLSPAEPKIPVGVGTVRSKPILRKEAWHG